MKDAGPRAFSAPSVGTFLFFWATLFRGDIVSPMRSTLFAVAALALLRIVVGLHFFLEGMSHLRDPSWSSAGFRKAAVGPLADWYRSSLPEVGDWSSTLGSRDRRTPDEAAARAVRRLMAASASCVAPADSPT